jgi:hypothetical protein
VAGALIASLGYSIFASHQRRRASQGSPTGGRAIVERFERPGEPAGVQR